MIQKNSLFAFLQRTELKECNPFSDTLIGTAFHIPQVITITGLR